MTKISRIIRYYNQSEIIACYKFIEHALSWVPFKKFVKWNKFAKVSVFSLDFFQYLMSRDEQFNAKNIFTVRPLNICVFITNLYVE